MGGCGFETAFRAPGFEGKDWFLPRYAGAQLPEAVMIIKTFLVESYDPGIRIPAGKFQDLIIGNIGLVAGALLGAGIVWIRVLIGTSARTEAS